MNAGQEALKEIFEDRDAMLKKDTATLKREQKIETLKKYLLLKVEQGDWRAVSDCANDIRVLEGK